MLGNAPSALNNSRTVERIAGTVIALSAWLGLAIQFYVTQTHPNLTQVSVLERTARYFEYFTILTNLMVAVSLSVALIAPSSISGRFFSRSSFKTAVALYISLVGIVYNVVLQGLHDFTGLANLADVLTHDVVPLLYAIYWFVFVAKGLLTWRMPFVWTIYPLIYLPYVLIKGSFTGRYPYPFLDVNALGIGAVLLNSFALTIVFLVLGEVFVVADKLLGRLVSSRAKPFQ